MDVFISDPGPLKKYHEDGPFMDPVIRCYSCGEIQKTIDFVKKGKCFKCESRRCRNINTLSEMDYIKCMNWGIDADFLALFEKVDE